MNYIIGDNVKIKMPSAFINDTVKEMVFGFLFRSVEVEYVPTNNTEIVIGDGLPVSFLGESVSSVTEKGVYIGAKDKGELMVTLFATLALAVAFDLEKGGVKISLPCGKKEFNPPVKRRMIQFCVVPNITANQMVKLCKLAGALGYTHIILEFWGTFKYDFLKELSWKEHALEKDQVKKIIKTIRDLGMTPVPQLAHFGHASGCRLIGGKHVVLDQNPALAHLFSADGWWWNFENPKAREVLENARKELYEVFGDGEYIHIGFDESFSYPTDRKATEKLCDYIEDLCGEIVGEGRTPLLWGDLYLHEPTVGIGKETGYEGNCESKEKSDYMFSRFPKGAIVCDWQYFVKESPWKSTEYFKKKGLNYMICPWFDSASIEPAIETIKQLGCYAYLQTTWDAILKGELYGLFSWYYKLFEINREVVKIGHALNNAAFLRKLSFADGEYNSSGWLKEDFALGLSL